ncbi:MAG: TlpA family protein disulfide reductase [Saprospiraceae bacterium]
MKRLQLLLLFVFGAQQIFAQANALVMGEITQVELTHTIDISVNQKYIDNEIKTFHSNILEDQSFAFAVEMDAPQLIKIIHARNPALIYLEAGDSLLISAAANSFQYSMKFDGPAGHNNTFLHQYFKDFPRELNQFKTLQYKKGTYWYSVDKKMDDLMQSFLPESFSKKILLRKEKALAALDFYDRNHPDKLSDNFKAYMTTEIYYEWAYHMLLYGTVFKGKHQIKAQFFEFLESVPLQADQLGSYYYREFLMAYFNYLHLKSDVTTNPYVGQYKLASDILIDQPLAFVQSELIARAFKKKMINPMLPHYDDYLKTSVYADYDQKITQVFQKAIKQHTGSPAPSFQVKDIEGNPVDLAQYKGKIVYLNFWASWCRPCIQKMNTMKVFRDELAAEGIVTIYVSLDKDERKWRNAIEIHDFQGIQVLASQQQNTVDLSAAYDIKALPQYFIIGKNGSFAAKPKSNVPLEIKTALLGMSR